MDNKKNDYKFQLGQIVCTPNGGGKIVKEKIGENDPTWVRHKEFVKGRFRRLSQPQYCIWQVNKTIHWVNEDEISLPAKLEMPPPAKSVWKQNHYSVGEVVAVEVRGSEDSSITQRLGTVIGTISNGFQYKVLFHDEPSSLQWDILAPCPYGQYIDAVLTAKNDADTQEAKKNLSLKEYLVSIQISHTFASTDFVEIDIESLSLTVKKDN